MNGATKMQQSDPRANTVCTDRDVYEACLRLDSADIQYRQPLKEPVKHYFTAYNLAFEDAWSQKRSRRTRTASKK